MNTPKEAATQYFKFGANVLALDGKAPKVPKGTWGQWMRKRQTPEQASRLAWGSATGVGLVAGIGGIRTYDVDDGGFRVVEMILDALGLPHSYKWVVESGSRKGWHVHVRCDENDAFPGKVEYVPKRGDGYDHIELRWANHQTAAPPSVHPDTGAAYQFINGTPDGPPAEVSAERIQAALDAVGRPKRQRSRTSGRLPRTSDADPSEVRKALLCIPPRPDYEEWVRIIAAVQDGMDSDTEAEALLKEWSPEEEAGEYSEKLASGLERISVATLFWIAAQHGYEIPSRTDKKKPALTVDDFKAALSGLEKTEAKMKAADLLEDVATMSKSDAQKCRILVEQAATVRFARSWMSDVKAERKEREAEAKPDDEEAHKLKHGELTAWIVSKIKEQGGRFALDESGALLYYKGGCYHFGGDEYVNREVQRILRDEGMLQEASTYRRNEVAAFIKAEAPRLWNRPPSDRICLKNCILNLETGEMEEHSPNWLSTVQIPIELNAEAEGTAWEEHFAEVLPDDAVTDEFNVGVELFAQLLNPARNKRKAMCFYGPGDDGKSLTLDLMSRALGLSNVTNVSLHELEQDSFARADLYGRMLNVCADLPSAPLKGTSVFKQITGGDRMSAQRKYQDRFNFQPHCHLLFSTNYPIQASDADEAFWSRWLIVPFVNQFKPGDDAYEDADAIRERLMRPEELSALLNAALDVLPSVRGAGVTETESMKLALTRMRQGNRPKPEDWHPHDGDGHTRDEPAPPVPAGSPAQNFEKEQKLDTGGVCPKKNALQSSAEGEGEPPSQPGNGDPPIFRTGQRVQTPKFRGRVRELSNGRLYVRPDDGSPTQTRAFKPSECEPINGESPF